LVILTVGKRMLTVRIGENGDSDTKKIERVLSPANKRKKDIKNKSSRFVKEISKDGKKSLESSSSQSSSCSKRQRSLSGSTDDSVDDRSADIDRSTKQSKTPLPNHHKSAPISLSNRKNVPVIDPIEPGNGDKSS